ncbi:hypothetical protein ACLB2K_066176 [Fragaria x ananassa]
MHYSNSEMNTQQEKSNVEQLIRWSPPPLDRVTLNFDGPIGSSSAAGGFIFRTNSGKPLVAASFNTGLSTVLVAKAMALRNSLICAKDRGFLRIKVEGDLKLVIDAISGVSASPWRLLSLIQHMRHLRNSFEFISFKHVFKEANYVANTLANLGHGLSSVCFWEECVLW